MFTIPARVVLIALAAALLCTAALATASADVSPDRPLLRGSGILTAPPPVGGYAAESAQAPAGEARFSTAALQSSAGYGKFVAEAGPGWSVQWNTDTGTPHLASGKAIAIAAGQNLTRDNIEQVCLGFVGDNADLLKVEPTRLRLAGAVRAGSCWYAPLSRSMTAFRSTGGQLTMSFTRDDRLIMFGADVYPGLVANTAPAIDRRAAVAAALADCGGDTGNSEVSAAELSILPVKRSGATDYAACWKFTVMQREAAHKWHVLHKRADR